MDHRCPDRAFGVRAILERPTPEKITEAHPASFSFLTDHEPVISLDGLWRFHPGDDARWASPAFDDSAWPLLRSDEPWTDQGYNQLSGFAWYRFRVQAPSPAMPLSLLLPSILTERSLAFRSHDSAVWHQHSRWNLSLVLPTSLAVADSGFHQSMECDRNSVPGAA
jgi:hypothetical protein